MHFRGPYMSARERKKTRAALEANRQRVAMAPNSFVLIPRRFAAPSPVHADQDSGRGRSGAEGTAEVTATSTEAVRKYGPILVAEVVVITFQKRRPAPREHPFNATTGRPACSGFITHVAEVNTSKG